MCVCVCACVYVCTSSEIVWRSLTIPLLLFPEIQTEKAAKRTRKTRKVNAMDTQDTHEIMNPNAKVLHLN